MINDSDAKVKFRKASNHCKRVLEAAKLLYVNKTLPRNLALRTFHKLLIVLNKGKSAIPPLFSDLEVLSPASDKAKLFAENFSKNSNLDDLGISLPDPF